MAGSDSTAGASSSFLDQERLDRCRRSSRRQQRYDPAFLLQMVSQPHTIASKEIHRRDYRRPPIRPYDLICHLLAGGPPTELNDDGWQQFVSLADGHGVAPLLYYTLSSEDTLPSVPASVQRALQRAYYASTAQQALLFNELDRITDVVEAPLVLLKGASLATTLYPEPATRPISDLDLLIPRSALRDAVAAVRALGYSEYAPEMGAGMHEAASHHVHLRGGPGKDLVVELHWNLISSDNDRYAPDLSWFWEQTEAWGRGGRGAREQGSGGTTTLQLTPTARLLFLAAHLMLQHGARDARLIWFYDLHLILTKCGDRIDWERLIAKADAFHWAPALYTALRGTQSRLGTPLPEAEMAALADAAERDPMAASLVERQSVTDQTRTMLVRSKLSGMSWRSRLRYIRNHLLPRPEYIRWRYEPEPAWTWPLYYLYRWLDILRDGLLTIARTVRGQHE